MISHRQGDSPPNHGTVMTPSEISKWLFDLLKPYIRNGGLIFDPCVGQGSLLKPWVENGYEVVSNDIRTYRGYPPTTVKDYLLSDREDFPFDPQLVVMNPPFSSDYEQRRKYGLTTPPELFLAKTLELFGNRVPIVMFVSFVFRCGETRNNSRRRMTFISGKYPRIKAIISFPKLAFSTPERSVIAECEVLVFNLDLPHAHYFYPEPITHVKEGD